LEIAMTATGWIGEDQGAAMPLTAAALQVTGRGPGDVTAIALARSAAADAREARDAQRYARDPDEAASALILRGYTPGASIDLAQRIQDAQSALAGARQKREDHAKAIARYSELRDKGQISVMEAARRMDAAEGPDEAEISRLERHLERLQRSQAQAQAAIAGPQPGPEDPLEAASRRAHAAFAEATRGMFEAAEAGRPVPAPRPFAGPAGGGAEASRSTEHTGPDCWVCAERAAAERAEDVTPPNPGMAVNPAAVENGWVTPAGELVR
jgi:hypothetical protein